MDDQQIHHLLQLKSYDPPSSHVVEEFISEFHRRQQVQPASSFLWLEQLKERLDIFFSELQIPTMAYVGATALALFFSALILQTNIGSHNDPTGSLLTSENFSAIHYYAAPINQNDIQPVSFEDSKAGEDSVFSSMSHYLKKKKSKKSLVSF